MAEMEAQVAYILEVMVSAAVSEVSKVVDGNTGDGVSTAEAEPVDQKVFHLSLVMAALAQDAVEKLCQLFQESKVTEVEELRRRLEATESDLRLALESQEKPNRQQNPQPSSEPCRRVVVICDTALKRMPFFRHWKSRKGSVRKITALDKEVEPDGPDGLSESEEDRRERGLQQDKEQFNLRQTNHQVQQQIQQQLNHQVNEQNEEPADVLDEADEPVDESDDEPDENDEPVDEQLQAAEGPVNAQLAYINKQTAYISRLVQKVRTASVERAARQQRGPKPRPLPEPTEALSCSVCGKVFYRQKSLDLHMLVHTGEKPYLCDVCGKGFIRKESLMTHQRLHSNVRSFTCDTCGKSFYLRNHLNRHKAVHTQQKPYKCQYCDKAFSNTGNLKRHVFLHTGEKPYTCDYCGKGFIQNVTMQAHRLTHTGMKPFKCHCGKAYTQKNTLRSHQMTHDFDMAWDSSIPCVACGSSETRESIREHLVNHSLPCSCVRCGQQLCSIADLRSHQKEHTGKKPHVCHICNKSFQSPTYLKIHVHNHSKDSEKRPFHCTVCGRSFAHQNTLTYHQAVHSGDKPYTCSTCGKSFSNPGNVHRHQLIHTGEKPYSCQTCGRSFNQSCSLKAHLRTHTGHKPYMCDHCGKSFSDRRNLKEHKCRSA